LCYGEWPLPQQRRAIAREQRAEALLRADRRLTTREELNEQAHAWAEADLVQRYAECVAVRSGDEGLMHEASLIQLPEWRPRTAAADKYMKLKYRAPPPVPEAPVFNLKVCSAHSTQTHIIIHHSPFFLLPFLFCSYVFFGFGQYPSRTLTLTLT
jgi:hypothetical protein